MLENSFDHLLPPDDELVRRETLILKMFDKFNIDEGDDPEPVDLDASDEMVEDDNLSSLSEASSIDDDDGEDSRSVVENIAQQLEPVIQRRVNAWPMKGVHLQLKTVDPSVSVVDWLKANQESTTTTKKYKKIVVDGANKITITTTKHTTTTTRKSSFNAIVPRPVAVEKKRNRHRKEAVPAIGAATSNDSIVPSTSLKVPEKRKKQKDQKKAPNDAVEEVPAKINRSESVDVSGSNKSVEGTFAKPKRPTKKQSKAAEENVETFAKPKRTTKKQFPQVQRTEIESKSERKISNAEATPSDDENKRRLRSRMEQGTVQQVREDSHSAIAQPKVKVTKKRNNQIQLQPSDRTSPEPSEKKKMSFPRNRSPLKEREGNRQESSFKLRNVRVNVERMTSVGATTRNGSRMQKNALEQTADTGANGMDPNSRYEAPTTSINQLRIPRTLSKLRTQQQRIVIHSPNSDKLLGTRIDDTFMLVTKDDYKKHIDAKYLRDTNAWNNSIVPMNRRIVYEPPTIDTIDDSGTDSECEDVLLTSYAYTGRIVQLNL